ncbi:unnamed protein product [Rotaria socialis]|uniref:Uncharacterized protein n=1 Tax=Rotaria socialis TaxID=392032 RepID=A0A819A886_9BILA|nr:unnamed protein product [Rotaria socialis]
MQYYMDLSLMYFLECIAKKLVGHNNYEYSEAEEDSFEVDEDFINYRPPPKNAPKPEDTYPKFYYTDPTLDSSYEYEDAHLIEQTSKFYRDQIKRDYAQRRANDVKTRDDFSSDKSESPPKRRVTFNEHVEVDEGESEPEIDDAYWLTISQPYYAHFYNHDVNCYYKNAPNFIYYYNDGTSGYANTWEEYQKQTQLFYQLRDYIQSLEPVTHPIEIPSWYMPYRYNYPEHSFDNPNSPLNIVKSWQSAKVEQKPPVVSTVVPTIALNPTAEVFKPQKVETIQIGPKRVLQKYNVTAKKWTPIETMVVESSVHKKIVAETPLKIGMSQEVPPPREIPNPSPPVRHESEGVRSEGEKPSMPADSNSPQLIERQGHSTLNAAPRKVETHKHTPMPHATAVEVLADHV